MTSNESRITNLEKEAMALGSRIEELASDTDESLRTLTNHVDQGFRQAHDFVQERFEEIKTTMATKEDLDKLRNEMIAMEGRINGSIATMEERLIDTIKQLWQQRLSDNSEPQP